VEATQVEALCAAGETFAVEFKSAAKKSGLSDRDIVEAVVCLANGEGGILLIGVDDDGTISGCPPRHGEITDPDRVRALIVNKTDPGVATDVEVVEVQDKPVVTVVVPNMSSPVGTSDGVYKRRALQADGTPECVPYRPHEMLAAGFSTQGRDYAEVAARGASLDDLDPLEFDRFRLRCSRGGDKTLANASDQDICRALRLVVAGSFDEITLGAVLLFGRPATVERYVPTSEVVFQELHHGKIVSNTALRVPLFKAADELFDRLQRGNTEQEVVLGLLRVSIPRVPERVMREAVANALVHRDYSELGPVHVRLDDDMLRVASPGGFPRGVNLQNLLEESRPRSVALADAFKRAGVVERAGRGIPDMYAAQLRVGRGEPDYTASTAHSVVMTAPTSDADLELVRFVLRYEDDASRTLNLTELRLLHEIKSMDSASLAELADTLLTQPGPVRGAVTRLVEAGLLEAHGSGRTRRFHLTAGFYAFAEDRNAYARVRAADPIQQAQLVLNYVEAYGSITRSQAAELCLLTPQQARRLLKRMTETGALDLVGERRLAHYVASGALPQVRQTTGSETEPPTGHASYF